VKGGKKKTKVERKAGPPRFCGGDKAAKKTRSPGDWPPRRKEKGQDPKKGITPSPNLRKQGGGHRGGTFKCPKQTQGKGPKNKPTPGSKKTAVVWEDPERPRDVKRGEKNQQKTLRGKDRGNRRKGLSR